MKKLLIVICIFLIIPDIVSGQCHTRPCHKLPTSEQLLAQLKSKPGYGLSPGVYRLDCNINDSIKVRLLYLLNWEWTVAEIEEYIFRDFEKNKSWYDIEKRASTVANGNDSLYKKAIDSIKILIRGNRLKDMKEGHLFKVDGSIMLVVGRLRMTEAIPILEKALNDAEHYNKGMVELSLAMLGYKAAERKVISECSPNPELSGSEWFDDFLGRGWSSGKGRKLIYIGSQESIYKLAEWMDTTKTRSPFSSGTGKAKSAAIVIEYLSYSLCNEDFLEIIKPFKAFYGDDEFEVTSEMIIACKRWLLKNKGKYKINKHYFP